ncbi:50S ribosomal protein L13 [Candidatus Peregrinibacteria bacterium]|nr:50S ribosomal protein L13 [Candidatus Peregrinibacteria bacterium]
MKTTMPKSLAPQWIIIDARGQSIGRVAVTSALILRGKHRPDFSPHRTHSDHVIVMNVGGLCIHPAKISQKQYLRHTGYFGHVKTKKLSDLFQKDPGQIIERAVWGMLPKNRLRSSSLRRLHVFEGSTHPFAAQKPSPLAISVSRGIKLSPC